MLKFENLKYKLAVQTLNKIHKIHFGQCKLDQDAPLGIPGRHILSLSHSTSFSGKGGNISDQPFSSDSYCTVVQTASHPLIAVSNNSYELVVSFMQEIMLILRNSLQWCQSQKITTFLNWLPFRHELHVTNSCRIWHLLSKSMTSDKTSVSQTFNYFMHA